MRADCADVPTNLFNTDNTLKMNIHARCHPFMASCQWQHIRGGQWPSCIVQLLQIRDARLIDGIQQSSSMYNTEKNALMHVLQELLAFEYVLPYNLYRDPENCSCHASKNSILRTPAAPFFSLLPPVAEVEPTYHTSLRVPQYE